MNSSAIYKEEQEGLVKENVVKCGREEGEEQDSHCTQFRQNVNECSSNCNTEGGIISTTNNTLTCQQNEEIITNQKSNASKVIKVNGDKCSQSQIKSIEDDYVQIPQSISWIPQVNARKRIRELYFTTERELGNGISSTVSCVYFHKQPHQKFALKTIRRDNKWGDTLFSTEARILGHLQHPGIIKLMNCFLDEENFYLLTEMGQFDLFGLIKQNRHITEDISKGIITKMLQAISFLHEKNIVHRDLKPENIIFTEKESYQPKIIDFGDSILVSLEDLYTEFVGTQCYLAPERLRRHYGWELKASDVWAIGVMAYEMITGKRCFYGKNHKEVFHRIRKGEWKWPKDIRLSRLCQDFVDTLLDVDAATRPSAERALQHPWLLTSEQQGPIPSFYSQSSWSNSSVTSNSSAGSFSSNHSVTTQLTIGHVYSEGHCAPIFKNLASNLKTTTLKNLIILGQLNKLSPTDKQSIFNIFEEIDRNRDGFIDVMDLLDGFMNENMNPNEAAALARTIIMELDRSNKGKISMEDFTISHLSYRLSQNDKSLKRLFLHISNSNSNTHNNSQLITDEEPKCYLTASDLLNFNMFDSLKISVDEVVEIIAEHDKDGDGQLSFMEFKDVMTSPVLTDSPLHLFDVADNNSFSAIQDQRILTIPEKSEHIDEGEISP